MTGRFDQYPSGADVGAFVLDLGSLYVRGGNAGDDCPKHCCYSFVGEYSDASTATSNDNSTMEDVHHNTYSFPVSFSHIKKNCHIRPCFTQVLRDQLINGLPSYTEVFAPVEPYQINPDVFEAIVLQIFKRSSESLKGKPIMLSEPNKHNRRVREAMGEVLFESLETEAIYLVKNAVSAAFAVGRTSGLVIDLGSVSTSITPVIEGYTLQKNIIELPIGGTLLDYQLLVLLKAHKQLDSKIVPLYSVRKNVRIIPNFPSIVENVTPVSTLDCTSSFLMHSHREVLRRMREAIARVSEDALPSTIQSDLMIQQPSIIRSNIIKHGLQAAIGRYELPDGTTIYGEEYSRKIPEVLFNFQWILGQDGLIGTPPASLLGMKSLTDAISQCILSCDVDSRRDLLGSIIFTGGCSLTPGLADRAIRQFQDTETVFGAGVKYKVVCPIATIEKRFLHWTGGSILASLASFQQMWVSKSEYNEHGISILERRCIQ